MASGNPTRGSLESPSAVPISQVRPVVHREGLWPQIVALSRYMVRTEVHTYAFSVAANVILSLFPFIVMMMTISRQVFHSETMARMVGQMMSTFLPSDLTLNHSYIMANMLAIAYPHKGAQIYSVVMLLISSTGVFLPLEVALNGVWGVSRNRSYLRNQIVSLGLAFSAAVLAMISVALTTGFTWIFFGHTHNIVFRFLTEAMLQVLALAISILIFFLIYWILPNRKVPARAVLPTAIVIGVLWEGAKVLYVLALPRLDLHAIYGPFYVSVGLMIWAFLSGLLLLAGAHFSATRYALSVARQVEGAGREQQDAASAQ
jgi:YihY family inner membrane protein